MYTRTVFGRAAAAWMLVLVLAFAMRPAHAVQEVCVQNQQQLLTALNTVRTTPQLLKLHQGTYHIDDSAIFAFNGNYYMTPGTSIHGGYTDNCASRVVDGTNTVLASAAPHAGILYLVGNLTLDALSIQFNHGLYVIANDDDHAVAPGTMLVLNRVRISASGHEGVYGPFTVDWAMDEDHFGEVDVVDSLIVGNNSDPTVCAMTFLIYEGQPTINVQNTTVFGNSGGGGLCMYNQEIGGGDGRGSLISHDNIFYSNPTVDLSSDTPNLDLIDNTIGFADIPTPNVPEQGRQSANPNLDANYRPIESPAASVINTGEYDNGTLPVTDFLGHTRVVGSRVDRGAFESSINDAVGQNVTNTNDSGPGSLRTAIASLNAGSGGIIGFDIGSACGPHVIHLLSPLPTITQSMAIIGASQPGSSDNDLDVGDDAVQCIVLDGSAGVADGLMVADGAGSGVQAVVTGLAFSGFSHAAVSFYGGKDHALGGSRIGGSVGGVSLAPSGSGIIVGPGISGVTIGGADPAQRNLILQASADGISLNGPSDTRQGSHDNHVENNYIGVGWTVDNGAYTSRGNTLKGVRIGGDHNTVKDNLIGDNGNDGIDILGADAADNVITGNALGIDDDGADLGNIGNGVRVENGAHDNAIRANHIGNNAGTGVRIVDGRRNTIRKNRIAANAGLGIDLAVAGEDANDGDVATEPDGYANRGLDHPVLLLAVGDNHGGDVSGHFLSTPGNYSIDVYSSPNCHGGGYGDGVRWLGSHAVTIPTPAVARTFDVAFTLTPPAIIANGAAITATATDDAGNTSEFSACSAYIDDRIFRNGFD
jgi:parallel beta-helix repeat protein